jgi:hypothetical protein
MIDKYIPLRDGLPTQSLIPTVLKHLVVDGTDVAICMPMHVANFDNLPSNVHIEFCPGCAVILRQRGRNNVLDSQNLQGT